jgi:hypothetical protein
MLCDLEFSRLMENREGFVQSSEMGTEYELEFEDEYDFGTIGRLEELLPAR